MTCTKFSVFESRLDILEKDMVVLSDGTRWRPPDSGLGLLRRIIGAERDLGRKPKLEDFFEEDQHQITHWAKYYMKAGSCGIVEMVTTACREVMSRS